jgi:hypothetical protein
MDRRSHLHTTNADRDSVPDIDNGRLSIFEQNLWRNILKRSAGYREEVVFKDDVAVGRLSYFLSRDRFVGISWGISPPLACRNGPVFSREVSDEEKPALLRTLIQTALRRHPLTSFMFTCDPYDKDAAMVRQEFIAAGFQHSTQVNTVQYPDQPSLMVPQPSDDAAINKRRSHINNARGRLEIVDDIPVDEFIAFYDANLKARNKNVNYVDAISRSLIVEGMAHGQVRILAARRKKKSADEPNPPLDAAIVIAWDRPIDWTGTPETAPPPGQRWYLLLLTYRLPSPGEPQEKPHPDANKLLIMEAAGFAAKHGLIFDTGGAATPGAEKFYRQLFTGKRSEESCDIFKYVKWHAGWYENNKRALKEAAARNGIRSLRMSPRDALLLWREFVRLKVERAETSTGPAQIA